MNEIDKEITRLYKKWPEIRNFLKSKGCDKTKAEDIFQEALVIYFQKKNDPEFSLNTEPFYYVLNTCKFLWYNENRKAGKEMSADYDIHLMDENSEWYEKEQKMLQMEAAIRQLGQKCRDLLVSFYAMGQSMVEIAKKLDFRNDQVAKVQKYRCIQKAKELINEQVSL